MDMRISGVFAAALTPLPHAAEPPDPDAFPAFLRFLADRGCHGALLLGTTGEGPSFSPREREAVYRSAVRVKEERPDFLLLAGTGTPSLDETIQLTRSAFDAGLDGVVVLPPYYYRDAPGEGIVRWFEYVMDEAVPSGHPLLAYHIPQMSGVPLTPDLFATLQRSHPDKFGGLKDSSGDPDLARVLGERFGRELSILTGNDRLFGHALDAGAAGCITAPANLFSPVLRRVWDARQRGRPDPEAEDRLRELREILDRYPPAAPTLKALLAQRHSFPTWAVRPPLQPLSAARLERLLGDLEAAGI